MSNKTRGWYQKFEVHRTDGTDKRGGKHDGCEYFVLDLNHDLHATAALRAYADSCEADYPQLAADIRKKVTRIIATRRAALNLVEALNRIGNSDISPELRGIVSFALAGINRFEEPT